MTFTCSTELNSSFPFPKYIYWTIMQVKHPSECSLCNTVYFTWHLTCHMSHVTSDMWEMVGGEHSLNMSGQSSNDLGVSAFWRYFHSLTHLNNYKAVFRIVPPTPGLFFKTVEQFCSLSQHLNSLCRTDGRTQICLASIAVGLWSS